MLSYFFRLDGPAAPAGVLLRRIINAWLAVVWQGGHAAVIGVLAVHGADMGCVDSAGNTGLHVSAHKGDLGSIRAFLLR